MALIYSPEEDSYLLEKVLMKELFLMNKNLSIFEVGIGSGYILEALKKMDFQNIFGVDINIDAVKHCQSIGFNCMKSDLFSNVEGKYDVIIFNPPYLPFDSGEDKESSLITAGGKKGGELINRFLCEVGDYLVEGSQIYLLVSSLSQGINLGKWKKKLVGEEKLFFEKLEVWKLSA